MSKPRQKTCRECRQEKPLSEYYTHHRMTDGRLNKCKACVKARVRAHRDRNIEDARAYDRQRYATDEARRARSKRHVSVYLLDGRHAEYSRRHREKYPERYAARTKLGNALRDGKIKKSPCEVCGEVRSQAHHEDYSRPLDVVWLCSAHHGETWRGPRK